MKRKNCVSGSLSALAGLFYNPGYVATALNFTAGVLNQNNIS